MQPTILVVESDDFVAQDLIQTIRDARPDARILTESTARAALRVSKQEPKIDTAFLHVRSGAWQAAELLARFAELGTHVVILDGEEISSQNHQLGWTLVPVPFSSGMIRSALDRSDQRRCAGG